MPEIYKNQISFALKKINQTKYDILEEMAKKYATREQKDPVLIDENKLKKMDIELIKDNLISIENGFLRHDSLKVGYLIFSYLMDGE